MATTDSVETRDSSGRFSSANILSETRERKRHATDLLRGIKAKKRKYCSKEDRDEEDNAQWMRATRSVTVSSCLF